MGYKDNKAKYEPLARKFAAQYGIDPDLFAAQIEQESGWNPKAGSSAGAQGIAQIIPSTAKGWGVKNVWDPEEALNAAAQNMSNYIKTYKNNKSLNPQGDYLTAHKLALAAYNAGPGSLQLSKKTGKPLYTGYRETTDYINRISKAYKGQNLNPSEGLSLSKDYGGYNQNTKPPKQPPSNQNNLFAAQQGQKDQFTNKRTPNMGTLTSQFPSQYPNLNATTQAYNKTNRVPDILGLEAQNQYNNKLSNLESTLAGYTDEVTKKEKQDNLFNTAIQAMQNTWGGTENKITVPKFKSNYASLLS